MKSLKMVVSLALGAAVALPLGCASPPQMTVVPVNGAQPIPVFQMGKSQAAITISFATLVKPFGTQANAKTLATDVTDWTIDLVNNPAGGIGGNGLPGPGTTVDYTDATLGANILARFVLNKAGDVGNNQRMKFAGVNDGTYRVRVRAWAGAPPAPYVTAGAGNNITKNWPDAFGPFAVSDNKATVSGGGVSIAYTTAGFAPNTNTELDTQVKLLDADRQEVQGHVATLDGNNTPTVMGIDI